MKKDGLSDLRFRVTISLLFVEFGCGEYSLLAQRWLPDERS